MAAVRVARQTLDTLQERWNEPIVLIAEGVVAHASGDHAVAAERLQLAVDAATAQGSHGIGRRAAATAAELGLTVLA